MNNIIIQALRASGMRIATKVTDDNEEVECIESAGNEFPTVQQLEQFTARIVSDVVSIIAERRDAAIDEELHVDEAMSIAILHVLEAFDLE